jgi:ABC-type multidrug transport system fused ATPase/permease subunit
VSQTEADLSLGRLGTGSRDDRLRFRLIIGLLVRCLHLLRPVRGHLALLFLGFSALALIFVPVGILLMDTFWTRVLQGSALTAQQASFLWLDPAVFVEAGALGPDQRREVLLRTIIVGLSFSLAATPCGFALYYYRVWILQKVNQVLRMRMMQQLQSLSLRFHADTKIGDAIYRMYQDSAMVTQLIDVLVIAPLGMLGRYLFGIVVVAFFDPWLAVILAALWPPLLLSGYWFSRRLRVRFRVAREANSALTSRIQETLQGIKVIKAYGAEAIEQTRFEADSRAAFDAAFAARGLLAVFVVLLFWLAASAIVASAGIAAVKTVNHDQVFVAALGFSAWTLGLFNYFKVRFADGASQLRQLFRIWGRTQDIAIGLDRVFELLDLEPEIVDAPDAIPLEEVHQGIRYRSVRFRYQPDRPGLESVSFEAQVGTISAIVGPTGSGKTTLMALLLRLFDPQEGAIEIDGVDIRKLLVASLREKVAVALQENLLFGTTVRENIRYAVADASDAQVREAARIAGADEFIAQLPEGYDTLLGERGTKLSTGQRQRLSIARAVLKDTPILILDEPTASLDAETELRVMGNLAEWGKGRMIFLITHRLSTIRRASQLLVLKDGRIAESGSHQELIAREGGIYRNMVETEEVPIRATAAEVVQ